MAQEIYNDSASTYMDAVEEQAAIEAREFIRQAQEEEDLEVLPPEEVADESDATIEKPLIEGVPDHRMTLSIGADLALGLGAELVPAVIGGAVDVPNQIIQNLEALANAGNEHAIAIFKEMGRIDPAIEELGEEFDFPEFPNFPQARSVTANFIRDMTEILIGVVTGGKIVQAGVKTAGEVLKKVGKGKVSKAGEKLAKTELSPLTKGVAGSAVAAGVFQDFEKGSEGIAKLLTEDLEVQNTLLEWLAEPDPEKSKILETTAKRMVGDLLDTATAVGFIKAFKGVVTAAKKAKKAFDERPAGRAKAERKAERARQAEASKTGEGALRMERNKIAKKSLDTLGDPGSDVFFNLAKNAEKNFNSYFRLKESLKEFAGASNVSLENGKFLINFSKLDDVNSLQKLWDDVTELTKKAVGKDPDLKRKSTAQTRFEAQDEFNTFNDFLGFSGKGPFSSPQVQAAKDIVISSARQIKTYMAKALSSESEADKVVARQALGAHAAIVQFFKQQRTEAGRTLNAYRSIKGEELDIALDMGNMVDAAGGIGGLDEMARMIFHSTNTRALNNSSVHLVKSTWGEAARTYVIVNWLSGIKTGVKNLVGNTSAAGWLPVERLGAGAYSKLFDDGSVEYGEAVSLAYGMLKGMRGGLALAFRSEKAARVGHRADRFKRRVKIEGITGNSINSTLLEEGSGLRGTALNMFGHLYALPTKILLEKPDMFFKNVVYEGQLRSLAYNQARLEGLKGVPLRNRINELVEKPPRDMDYDSFDMADQMTYVKKVDGALKKIKDGVASIPLGIGKMVNPFANTRMNLWAYKFDRTPLAFLAQKNQTEWAAGGRRRALVMGRVGATTMALQVCVDMALDGLITGDGPENKNLNRSWQDTGKKPRAVKYGDKYFRIDTLDPQGSFIASCGRLGEIIQNVDEKTSTEIVMAMTLAYSSVLDPEQFIGGIGEFLGAIDERNFFQDTAKFLGNFIPGAIVPMSSFLRGVGAADDPVLKLKGTAEGDPNLIEGIDTDVAVFIEDLFIQGRSLYWMTAKDVPPHHNKYGEPISTASGFGFLYDMAGPMSIGTETKDPLKIFVDEHEIDFGEVKLEVENVPLTIVEKSWYQKFAREDFTKRFRQLIKEPGFLKLTDGPNGMKSEIVQNLAESFLPIAQDKLKKKFPGLQRRILDSQEKDIEDKTGSKVSLSRVASQDMTTSAPVLPVIETPQSNQSIIDQLGGR